MKQKLVIAHMPVKEKDRIVTVLFENDKAAEIYVSDPETESLINNIYVGHADRVVPRSGGAFVRFGDGTEGFLPAGRCKRAIYKNPKKNNVLKAGDELLVLVESEAMKTKLPGLTAEIKLTGKYVVVSSGINGFNFSKKLSKEEKDALFEGLSGLESEHGFIVRTQAGQADISEVIAEAEKLSKRLGDIIRYGVMRPSGACLFRAGEIWSEKLKQLRSGEIHEIVTDDKDVYEAVLSSDILNDEDKKSVRLYEDSMVSLYRLNNLSRVLDSALEKKIWLGSGASVIIEQTEAFVCIDVNSSRSVKGKRTDDAFMQINLEAAKEAARQIRLRQLSGTILIDFINTEDKEADEKLIEAFRSMIKGDPADVNVIDITKLGIMEITRRKKGRSLIEQINALQ